MNDSEWNEAKRQIVLKKELNFPCSLLVSLFDFDYRVAFRVLTNAGTILLILHER